MVAELKYLEANGYGSVYFVDDHFLLQPKRIEAICQGSLMPSSQFSGESKDGWIPSRNISSPLWRRPTVGRSCLESKAEAKKFWIDCKGTDVGGSGDRRQECEEGGH